MAQLRRIFLNWIYLFSLVLPPAVIGWAFFDLMGLAAGAAAGVLACFGVACASERVISSMLRAQRQVGGSLFASVTAVCARKGRREPAIYLFPEPFPAVLVSRAWMSRGAIYFSQGTLSVVSQKELEDWIELSLKRLLTPGLSRQSSAAALAHWISGRGSREWIDWWIGAPAARRLPPFSLTQAVTWIFLIPFVKIYLVLSRHYPRVRNAVRSPPCAVPGLPVSPDIGALAALDIRLSLTEH